MIVDFKEYIEQEMLKEGWLNSVTPQWHAPDGTFKNGSPQEIAKTLCDHAKSLKGSMSELDYYLNRGGVKIPGDIKAKCEQAKEILRKICPSKEKAKSKETKTA